MKRILKPKYINDTALDILRREGVFLCADCGGLGTCGKCRIRIAGGNSEYIGEAERKVLSDAEIADGVRLACCLKVGEIVYEMQGADSKGRGEDSVTGSTAGSSWEDGIEVEIPDSSLIPDTCGGTAGSKDGTATSEGGTASAEPEPLQPAEIIAVDYGTTVISGSLVDLNRGVTEEASVINHQKAYGADVISRVRAANDGFHEELRHVSEDDLANLTVRLGREPDNARYIVSGNTVMEHLISGFSCKGLGEYPYTPVDISLRRDGNITFLPGISAFVGADIVSGICACSLDQASDPWLYVDIGTNGEMALGTGSKIFAASAPAGPAFEGGNLSCGVPAVPGAVSGVVIAGSKPIASIIDNTDVNKAAGSVDNTDVNKAAGSVDNTDVNKPAGIIDNTEVNKPCGICGSGVIDLVAELYKNGLIDENGTLADEFAEEGFPVAGNVLITQKDIREVQKAKAAIRAGIETLIEESGVRAGDIRKLVIAGSFGSSVNMDNAAKIGLIPEELLAVSATAGNASLTGATLYALDMEFGERLKRVAREAEIVDVSQMPEFSTLYVRYMGF